MFKNIVSPVDLKHSGSLAAVGASASTTPANTSTTAAPTSSAGTAAVAEPAPDVPAVIAAPIAADTLAYGDIIDYDPSTGIYSPSQAAYDPAIYGVAIEHPPVVLLTAEDGVPILKQGRALVNVTLENGPIAPGDEIAASSIRGKGMRADTGSKGILGIAREAFTSDSNASTTEIGGKSVSVGTIAVDVAAAPSSQGVVGGCTGGTLLCAIASKVNATPLVSLLRYLVAAAIALGGIYLAFRTFMADAVNGVLSVGRNPRAKAAIQAMVIFNGVIAVLIAVASLAVGLLILFIKI